MNKTVLTETPYAQLFQIEKLAREEIDRRATAYLRAMGYTWYTIKPLSVSKTERGTITIVSIVARTESYGKEEHIHLDVPLKQFEAIVPEMVADA